MWLDEDVVTIRADRRGRANLDAQVAARLLRARVRADRCLVVEVLRLFEAPHRAGDLGHRRRLCRCVRAWVPIALWRLVHRKEGVPAEIEHQIECFAACDVAAVEVDGPDRAAGDDALAVIAAAVEIDLVAPVDRLLRTDLDAGVATRTDIEVDRIFLRPCRLERAEPTGEALELARVDRVSALRWQLAAHRLPGDEHRNVELLLEPLGPAQRGVSRTDDQQAAFGPESHARHRLGLGPRRGR